MTVARIVDVLLAAGAATRLTRFVVTEDLGRWLIKDPAARWSLSTVPPGWDGEIDHAGWRVKLVSGLDCPFCVGTWLHLAAQASAAVVPSHGYKRSIWRVLAGGLTASYLAAHLMVALGDFDDDDDE